MRLTFAKWNGSARIVIVDSHWNRLRCAHRKPAHTRPHVEQIEAN